MKSWETQTHMYEPIQVNLGDNEAPKLIYKRSKFGCTTQRVENIVFLSILMIWYHGNAVVVLYLLSMSEDQPLNYKKASS